jgi:hypothetical protein
MYVSEINFGWEQERYINGVKEKVAIIWRNSVRGANGAKENYYFIACP